MRENLYLSGCTFQYCTFDYISDYFCNLSFLIYLPKGFGLWCRVKRISDLRDETKDIAERGNPFAQIDEG